MVVATDKDHSIGVTPPFAVSAFAYWAHTDFIPRALIVVLVWAGLIVLGLPFALEARRRGWRAQPLGFAMAGVGALAMAVFAVLTASYEAGCVAAAAVLAACLYRSFAGWRDRRAEFRRIAAENIPAMLLWLGVAILYTALIASSNSGAGSWSANEFFAPLRWSSDNHLPILFADGLISDAERAQIVFGPWLATDRGPLMAVLLVFARLLLHPLTLMADSAFAAVVYPVAGITIMSSWAALLPWFCRAAGVRRYWVVVVLVLSSPLMIFNTVYIWPKLLGASYALASFLVLSDMARQGRAIARPSLDLAAVLAVLSYLSHGSNAFTLVVIALAFALPLLRSGIVPLGLASASALLVYAPWAWWQAVVQPHGNALVRSALAGDFAFDDRERSILQDIVAAYAGQDLWGWLKGKLLGLRFMTGYKVEWTSLPELVSTHAGPTWFGGARVLDFYVGIFALGISLVGVVLVAACAARVPGLSRRPAEFGFLVRAAGVGFAAGGLPVAGDGTDPRHPPCRLCRAVAAVVLRRGDAGAAAPGHRGGLLRARWRLCPCRVGRRADPCRRPARLHRAGGNGGGGRCDRLGDPRVAAPCRGRELRTRATRALGARPGGNDHFAEFRDDTAGAVVVPPDFDIGARPFGDQVGEVVAIVEGHQRT